MENMIRVASSEGIDIYCPADGKFSFFNSPYFAHRNFIGIDIYPNLGFGEVAPSPVSGEVIGVREVGFFESRSFECSSKDYVILMKSLENKRRIIKIIHVKPIVKVGEKVIVGGELGSLIRSGFFDFWTEPHIHVEIKDPSNPLRARGGYKIRRVMQIDENEMEGSIADGSLSGLVIESKSEYSLIALNHDLRYGLPVDLNGKIGFIDGGIPHYGFFGVHTNFTPEVGDSVKFLGGKIGSVVSVFENMALCSMERHNLTFKINGKSVRLSLYLYPSKPKMKIVPYKIGQLNLQKFEKVRLTLNLR